MDLAGEGWKTVFSDCLKIRLHGFNTPKSAQTNEMFRLWLGLPEIANCWRHGTNEINNFVSRRGEIAHNGADATYVPVRLLREYRTIIEETVKDTDDCLATYIRDDTIVNVFPWRRT